MVQQIPVRWWTSRRVVFRWSPDVSPAPKISSERSRAEWTKRGMGQTIRFDPSKYIKTMTYIYIYIYISKPWIITWDFSHEDRSRPQWMIPHLWGSWESLDAHISSFYLKQGATVFRFVFYTNFYVHCRQIWTLLYVYIDIYIYIYI